MVFDYAFGFLCTNSTAVNRTQLGRAINSISALTAAPRFMHLVPPLGGFPRVRDLYGMAQA